MRTITGLKGTIGALAAIFWLMARSVLTHAALLSMDQQMKYNIDDFETKITEEEMAGEDDDEGPKRRGDER